MALAKLAVPESATYRSSIVIYYYDRRAKDNSTLVLLSPSLRSNDKFYTGARINTFAVVSKTTII